MKVVLSRNAYASVLSETFEKIRTETGGVFLGCYQEQTWYIVEAIDPGPRSVFREDYFEYDQPYTAHLINKCARMYEYKLGLVGLWHRHPGSFDIFSTTDDGTNYKYASLNENGAISVLVNIDPVFRLSIYHVLKDASGHPRYTQLAYEVSDDGIPDEIMRRKTPESIEHTINLSSIRRMGLSYYMPLVVKRLCVADESISLPTNVIPFPSAENDDPESVQMDDVEKDVKERLISYVIPDLEYLTDTIGFNLSTSWHESNLLVNEKQRDGGIVPIFVYRYLPNNKCCIMYNNTLYECKKEMFNPVLLDIKYMNSAREARRTYIPGSTNGVARETSHSAGSVLDGVYKFLYTFLGIDQKG